MTDIGLLRLTDGAESPMAAGRRGDAQHTGREAAPLYRPSEHSIPWEETRGRPCRPVLIHSAPRKPRALDCQPAPLPVGLVPTPTPSYLCNCGNGLFSLPQAPQLQNESN